ncbi:MAG: hypothetical protein KY396_09385 [Actinobacteria bacterium]|nr:hypothetical protein [Actinomycetota bacterium]
MRGSRGRIVTWIVVVAVGALMGAATLDAVRGAEPAARDDDRVAQRGRLEGAAADLATAGVVGALSYVDGDCRAHTIRLPLLKTTAVPPTFPCRIAPPLRPPRAFLARPGETTATVRREAVALVGAASPRDVAVRALAWLDDSRVAAIVTARRGTPPRRTMIAVFDGGGLVGSAPWLPSRSARFVVSPRGSFFAVATREPSRFVLLDRNAEPGALADVARDWFGRTSLSGARAIAWSPDERWTALAKNESVYVFTTEDRDPRLVRLPIEARDLSWD